MTQWTNQAPNPHGGIYKLSHNTDQFSGVPNFQQTSGVINGTSPRSFNIVAPIATNFKRVINAIPTFLSIKH